MLRRRCDCTAACATCAQCSCRCRCSGPKLRRGQELWLESKSPMWATGTLTVTFVDQRGQAHFDGGYVVDPVSLVMYDRLRGIAGRCYPSEAEYLRQKDREETWRAFQQAVIRQWTPPKKLSSEEIRHAAEILGLSITQLSVDHAAKGGVPSSDPSQGLLL